MAINRAPFNALVDDDGSGLTGTVWNKDKIKTVILDTVDAAMVSLPLTQDMTFASNPAVIRPTTADGADSNFIRIEGGDGLATRGAFLDVAGNESIIPGLVRIFMGNVAGAAVQIYRSDGTIACAIDGATGAVSIPYGRLQFPATANPSTDAYTQDDYREGTWVPVDSSGAGLALSSAGTYVKIGRLCVGYGHVSYPATANGAAAIIGGLPFAHDGRSWGNFTIVQSTAAVNIAGSISGSTATLWLVHPSPSGSVLNNQLTGALLRFMVSYIVA